MQKVTLVWVVFYGFLKAKLIMTIKTGGRVKYIGDSNNWTYTQDITPELQGSVVNTIINGEKAFYQVEFDNGINASIEINHLEKIENE
jgi:hypothetical protein